LLCENKDGWHMKYAVEPDKIGLEFRKIVLDPESFFQTAIILKDSRSVKAGMASLSSGRKIFLKRYNCRSFCHSLRCSFKESRALRSFNAGLRYSGIGAMVPEVLGLRYPSSFFSMKPSYLFLAAAESSMPCQDFFYMAMSQKSLMDRYIHKIGSLLRKIHDHGLMHGDTKLSNFYIVAQNDACDDFEIGLWDFDSTFACNLPLPPSKRVRDLGRTVSSFKEMARRTGADLELREIALKILSAYGEYFPNDGIFLVEKEAMRRFSAGRRRKLA